MPARKVIKVLERIGFVLVRQSGSHKIYKNKEGRRVTVPFHSGKILHPKVLRNILRDVDLTVERFKELMAKWMDITKRNTSPSSSLTPDGVAL